MISDRPFSSEELAERWGVSAQHIRDLIRLGTLRHFRVGRLIRIPAKAVNEFEECQSTGSSSSEASSTPSGAMSAAKRRERPYVPQTAKRQNAA
jgi:excisionase family DNA binding protein